MDNSDQQPLQDQPKTDATTNTNELTSQPQADFSSNNSEKSLNSSAATQTSSSSEADDLTSLEMGEDSRPDSSPNTAAAIDQALTNNEPVTTKTIAEPTTSSTDLNPSAQTPKKKKLGLIIAIIIALVALLGGGAAAYKFLVIDNQPQNFLDRAVSTTMSQKKPLRIVQKITPGGQDQDTITIGKSVTGETFFNPETKMAKHHFTLDNLLVGKTSFDLMVDLNKQNFYVKINLDKKLLATVDASFFNPLQSRYPTKSTNLIEQIYNKINNQWFLINEDILKELMEGSGANVDLKSVKNNKDLIAKCQNSKDFSLLKFIEVKQELNKKDHYRSFEVQFSKSMLKDSIDKHPDNQCLQEIKKSLDKSNFSKANNPKTVITVDTKTMLIKDIQMSDENSIVDIEINYNSTATIEVPKDAKPLSQLKSLIEDAQKSFISSFNLESSTPSDSL